MEHAAVWLQEMDVKSAQAEQGIVAEIKKKEEPRGALRWNKSDKDDDVVRVNKIEKRKIQEWRTPECCKFNVRDDPTPLQRLRPCDVIVTL
ncbi:hypothetical protein NDU88_000377 [Pleurodeles waltl]|uniref:Uncharacterized protein n=1 Tax=Pleurodeles waltl TaxID=8319 RepID=A0AAV7P2B2_PLEWA|nr:hypothetical protein NDU88_000377 [Pleurodeles waltl]